MVHGADLGTLRTFLGVYRSGGVAKAAEGLGLSQPAVSRHLKVMEHLAGRALFERSGRGTTPTQAGHLLAAQVSAHLDALEGTLGALARTAAGHSTPLFLGAPADVLSAHVLPRLTPLLAEGRQVHCRTGLSPVLTEAVVAGELDLAVVTKIEQAPTRQLHLRHLCDEEFVLVGRAGEPPYHDAEDERPFIGYSHAMPMARRYFRACWGAPPPLPVLTVTDMRAVVSAVLGGAGLSVVPRYLAQEALDARTLTVLHTPTETVGNSIYLAALRGREQLPGIRAVFDLLCPSA